MKSVLRNAYSHFRGSSPERTGVQVYQHLVPMPKVSSQLPQRASRRLLTQRPQQNPQNCRPTADVYPRTPCSIPESRSGRNIITPNYQLVGLPKISRPTLSPDYRSALDPETTQGLSPEARRAAIVASTHHARARDPPNADFVLHGVQAVTGVSEHRGGGDHYTVSDLDETCTTETDKKDDIVLAGSKMNIVTASDISLQPVVDPASCDLHRVISPVSLAEHSPSLDQAAPAEPSTLTSRDILPLLPPTFRARGVLRQVKSNESHYVMFERTGSPSQPTEHACSQRLESNATTRDPTPSASRSAGPGDSSVAVLRYSRGDNRKSPVQAEDAQISDDKMRCLGDRVKPKTRARCSQASTPQMPGKPAKNQQRKDLRTGRNSRRARNTPASAPPTSSASSTIEEPKPSLVDRCIRNLSPVANKSAVLLPLAPSPPKTPRMHTGTNWTSSKPQVHVSPYGNKVVRRRHSRQAPEVEHSFVERNTDIGTGDGCCLEPKIETPFTEEEDPDLQEVSIEQMEMDYCDDEPLQENHNEPIEMDYSAEPPCNTMDDFVPMEPRHCHEEQLSDDEYKEEDISDDEDLRPARQFTPRIIPRKQVRLDFNVSCCDSVRRQAMDQLFQQRRANEIQAALGAIRSKRNQAKQDAKEETRF